MSRDTLTFWNYVIVTSGFNQVSFFLLLIRFLIVVHTNNCSSPIYFFGCVGCVQLCVGCLNVDFRHTLLNLYFIGNYLFFKKCHSFAISKSNYGCFKVRINLFILFIYFGKTNGCDERSNGCQKQQIGL